MDGPDFLIISGAPGSGKTTLARPLAEFFSLPLLSKDTIKENLMNVLEVADVESSKALGRAAITTMLAIARDNGCAVIESTWRASVSTAELQSLPGRVMEVFCDVDAAVCRMRYSQRMHIRHPGHLDRERLDDDSLWQGETAQPVNGGWPLLRVDTSTPVDTDQVGWAIRTLLGSA